MARLLVDGLDVAPLEIAEGPRARSRGLLGRDGLEGAIWLAPARQVHSLGMRFDLDVAFVAADGTVLQVRRLPRNRLSPVVRCARGVLEAQAGRFAEWGLVTGSTLRW